MEYTIANLADQLDARLEGNGDGVIKGVSGLEAANEDTITFASGDKNLKKLKEDTVCGAVIVSRVVEGYEGNQLIVDNVDKALIKVLDLFAPKEDIIEGIDSDAKISPTAKIAAGASIASGVVVSNYVEIGAGALLSTGCEVGENVKIGKNCRIGPNVVIYRDCVIGNNVIIQANTVIGSTGFGYSFIEGSHRLIPHNGSVVIEDYVDIGACCCIDRAKFANTVIGAGTKIDNLVQVAHNVIIGKCCLIAAQVGIAGSTVLGDGVVIAGQAGLCDNIEVGSGVQIGAKAGVMNNIADGKKIVGIPAQDFSDEVKKVVMLKKLSSIIKDLKTLKKKVEVLEAAKDDKN